MLAPWGVIYQAWLPKMLDQDKVGLLLVVQFALHFLGIAVERTDRVQPDATVWF